MQQLTSAALGGYEPLRLQVVLPQDGYVTAYVGNESDVDVLFDDVSVEHRPGLQVQENQYDPWGLSLAGLDYQSPGLRELNQYQFNGKERQLDLGLGWSDYKARFYDGQLGRWHSIDPLADHYYHESAYNYVFNNPLNLIDPTGRGPEDPHSIQFTDYSYKYNGKHNHTVVQTTVNVLYSQNKKGEWIRTATTSTTSLSFKTSSNKDGSVKLTYTGATTGTKVETANVGNPNSNGLTVVHGQLSRDLEKYNQETPGFSQTQAQSSHNIASSVAADKIGDVLDGVKGWFNKNGAYSNPFMLPKENLISPIENASIGFGAEGVKFLIDGKGLTGAGLAGAAAGLIVPIVDYYNAGDSERHVGKTAQIAGSENT